MQTNMTEVKTKDGDLVMAEEPKIDWKVLEAITKKVLAYEPKKNKPGQRAVRDSNPRTGESPPAT